MSKFVLACLLTISCSTVCCASDNHSSGVIAQADGEPALRGALPATTPAATQTTSTTSTATSTATVNPSSGASSTTTTTSTTTVNTFNPSNAEAQQELKQFDATLPDVQATSLPAGALQGTAKITDIEVSARNLKECPLLRDHDKGLKYIEVTVKNSGQNIAVILGNSAHADLGTGRLPTAPASDAEDSNLPRLNGKGKLAVGVVAAFSLGYAAPIFYENLTPDQHAKRSLGDAIGRDGARREVEAGHFGVRVIMPGDETTGWIAFRCPRNQDLKSLVIPVSYTRSAVPSGSVTVPVANSLAK
ncbi:MAG: hypothetical protein U0103_15660 [Candidatus Obscuribacterales bacterium]